LAGIIEIKPFRSEDQEPVQALILAGLEEHWGFLDESKNQDLKDISASYQKEVFLVAWFEGEIIGTGAFISRSDETAEVVRMSVAVQMRRRGFGRQILYELCCQAVQTGYRRVILETTDTWQDVISFYNAFGFQITHYTDGDVYFVLNLQEFQRKCIGQ